MKLDVFSVFDSKIGAFAQPFFSSNISTAQRAFAYAANDPTTDIGRFPADMALFHLGTWDNDTCEFDLITPFRLSLAISFVNKPEATEE